MQVFGKLGHALIEDGDVVCAVVFLWRGTRFGRNSEYNRFHPKPDDNIVN